MSLNGLDGVAVAEAHQAALAEAGGWFLLRYINRDTVELLQQGAGGIQEVRSVIEQYDEKSPLYGLLHYRRKKVILKYVPEGTSRLLQVRLTVQFQSVLESFSPHDTVFTLTAPSELTDSALGLNMMLPPSGASLKSSNSSLRRRRLDEISEDTEEVTLPAEDQVKESAPLEEMLTPSYGRRELDELPASAVLAKALLAKRKEEADGDAASTHSKSLQGQTPEAAEKDSPEPGALASSKPPCLDKTLPATPDTTQLTATQDKAIEDNGVEVTSNVLQDPAEPLSLDLSSHHLSPAESDSISQWSNNVVASYTSIEPKKKKLGPRPHIEAAHRPKTSGTTDGVLDVRPVANLPNRVRVSNKPVLTASLRPGSQHSTKSVPARFAPAGHSINAPPHLPSPTRLQHLYKPSEGQPSLSRPASATAETSAATPEKLRLMKALQLRKRNMLLAQRASSPALPSPLNAHTHNASDSSISTDSSNSHLSSAPSQEQLSSIDEESKITQSSSTTSPTFTTNISEDPSTKASSFAEQDDVSRKRRSLSSATSSSITPTASLPAAQHQTNPAVAPAPVDSTDMGQMEISSPADEQDRPPTGAALVGTQKLSEEDDPATLPRGNNATEHKEEHVESSAIKQCPPESERDELALAPSSQPTLKTRQLAPKKSLRILPSGDTSSSDVSDDDSLIEELHNATVHEAKPVSVARSPVTPIMSIGGADKPREVVNKPSAPSYQSRRSASSTPDGKSSGSIRSVSTALPQWPPAQVESSLVPLTKKPTLGSGISRRIKALEVLTTRDVNSLPAPQPVREASGGRAGFTAFLKRSAFLPHQQTPNMSTETSPPKQLPASAPQYEPDTSSAATGAFRRPSKDGRGPVQKGDTISVTARIVRDNSHRRPPVAPSSSYHTPLNLFRSPLIVEHEKHEELPRNESLASMHSISKSPSKSDKGRFSFSSHRSTSQTNLGHSDFNASKFSLPGTHKKQGPGSASDAASSYEEKPKGSRTSRLMKRMSNLTSPRNKGHSSAKEQPPPRTIEEQSELSRQNSTAETLMHVVNIGDVNVQFPESLLWKRRYMRVDDQGYLIFSPPATDANMRSVSRKYHLSDFNRPSLPDLEREEMAWSILLDLKDGQCIQCACEGRVAREQVLQMLVDAHGAYHQLYGDRG
ncbi:hypothetical protein ABEF95_012037 [Exophiala dermatitidis]